MDTFLKVDGNILLWIQDNLRNEILTPFMTAITHLGDAGIFWILASLVMLVPQKTRRIGFAGILALLFSLLFNNLILKPAVARIRPYEAISDLKLLIEKQKDFSFPSGHTGASFAAATAYLKHCRRRYGIAFLILAGIIAFSRLYVGVHYPTDVLVGLITGVLSGYLGYRLGSFVEKQWKKKAFPPISDENTMEK